jgi:glyoxylase-like metal-dependent hydrolase (beta-lactamase superfamily II)
MNIKKLLSVTLLLGLINSTVSAANTTRHVIPDYPAQQVSPRVWVIHGPTELPNPKNQGFMNNPGIVLTTQGVVIVDPGSSLETGEMVLRVLKKITPQPVVAVFNTHVHGDHWLGNQAIVNAYPNVKIFASPEMIAEAKAGAADFWVKLMYTMTKGATKGTVAVIPNTVALNGETIKIGDTDFRIYHNKQAHTKTDIMIEVVEDRLMFLGDNAGNKRILRISDGNFMGNIEAIDIALATNARYFVPGHGPSGTRAVALAYRSYLTGIHLAAKQAFENNMDSSDVKPIAEKNTTAFKNWANYKDEIGRQSVQAYAEVETAEF